MYIRRGAIALAVFRRIMFIFHLKNDTPTLFLEGFFSNLFLLLRVSLFSLEN